MAKKKVSPLNRPLPAAKKQQMHATKENGRVSRWQRNGLERFHASLINSLDGLRAVFLSEQAFRWGVYLGLIFFSTLFVISYFTGLELRRTEWLFLLSGYLMLLAFELINSSIEILCDMIEPNYNQLIKAAKDMGSAAVFLCYLFNGAVWLALVVLPVLNILF